MKNFVLSYFLILFSLLFQLILNQGTENGCSYVKDGVTKNTKDDTTDDSYLKSATGMSAAIKCFYLTTNTTKCCYNSVNNKCTSITSDTGIECPERADIVKNNCGMAYIYKPKSPEYCTDISLVQGYCCYIKTKSGNTACVRTKELNEEKNSKTEQIEKYVKDCSSTEEIESVICIGSYFNYYWLLFALISVIIL